MASAVKKSVISRGVSTCRCDDGALKPIAEFDTVKTWGEGLRKQWGGDLLAEEPEMVEALRDCDFAGEDPDSIIAKLFRIRKEDGEKVLSVKWRRHYAGKVRVPALRAMERTNGAARTCFPS
jgi:hypothetical protein